MWPCKKLELLAANEPYSFVGGPFGSKLTSRDYVAEGVPVIRGSNLNNGRFLGLDDFVFVSERKVSEDLCSNLAAPGDMVFTQRGTLGQVAIIPEDGIFSRYVISQSQMKLTIDETKADKLFLYYYFSSREAIQRIVSFTSSSGVPHINLTVLRNFEVPVPPLGTQKAIADILSAYDDLIENNRRRIQLLEAAARLLYQEWFVHLRFPGHEHVPITDGVPEGWRRTPLGEVITLKRGYDLPSQGRELGLVPIVSSSGISGFHNVAKAKAPGVVTGRYGTLGSVYLIQEDFWPLNTALYVHDFKVTDPHFTFHLLTHLLRGATSAKAAVPGVNRNDLHRIEVLLPPAHLRQVFAETVQPIHGQIATLEQQSLKLSEARDLLLPRLMNGEVPV